MKYLLPAFVLIMLALPASAENLHPSGWTEKGSNTESGNRTYEKRPMTGPNRVYTRDEYNQMQKERSKSGSSWLSSGTKPTITRNGNTTHLKKTFENDSRRAANNAITSLFNE